MPDCALMILSCTIARRYLYVAHDEGTAQIDASCTTTRIKLGGNACDIMWGKAVIATGGGACAVFGTIGGSGPSQSSQGGWMRVVDSTCVAFFVPFWR